MKIDAFPPAQGVPMHLLTERGLHRAFIKTVLEHRRDGRPVVTDHDGEPVLIPADQLESDLHAAQLRMAELEAEIARYRRSLTHSETAS